MEEQKTKSVDFVGNYIGNSNISMYDKSIKRYGFLTRCEERVIFEKIVISQNEIIKDLIKHEDMFKIFNSKRSDSLYKGEFLDLIHFDANELGDLDIPNILDNYRVFFEVCESA